MNITIQRNKPKGEFTHGHLSIDGLRICDTLENTNGLAPAGVYPITLIKCKHHSRKMPVLLPQPSTLNSQPLCTMCKKSLNPNPSSLNHTLPCWCPMLKPGNGVHNRLDGSILVGVTRCPGLMIHPKTTFDPLYERIRKSLSRGNEVLLTITSFRTVPEPVEG